MNIESIPNNELRALRSMFQNRNFDIRFVGGCVRDLLHGSTPKDIDLCTDANPEEQIAIYKENNLRYIETGLQHGTVSVVLNNVVYEITSCRFDKITDGRHAIVEYTTNWYKDAERRDFTFNSMFYTFDHKLVDYFNGKSDLENGIVRFVGDADTRIKEDYLRIMRWFRFRGRYESEFSVIESTTKDAIIRNAPNLKSISRERIWSELKKILQHSSRYKIIRSIHEYGIAPYASLPNDINLDENSSRLASNQNVDYLTLMVQLYPHELLSSILHDLKSSRDELNQVNYLVKNLKGFDPKYALAVNCNEIKLVFQAELLYGLATSKEDSISYNWNIPVFEISGQDLINQGIKPSPFFSKILKHLKNKWADNNYIIDKNALPGMIAEFYQINS